MKIYSKNDDYILYHGNMLDMLNVIPSNSVDSIVTDPPYGLTTIVKRFGKENSAPAQFGSDGAFSRLSKGFMGKEWDGSGIEYNVETWKKCYEILKDGGYLLAFGGTRTYHKIASAIEEAGFEIRDCIMWIYGSGFPKSMNISKGLEAREKYGKANTRTKRVVEQSCEGEAYKIKQTNNGAMDEVIETTRKHYLPSTELAKKWQGWGTTLKPAYEPIIVARKPFVGSLVNNVIKNGVGGINIDECRIPFEDTKNPATNPLYRKEAGYKLPVKGLKSNGVVGFTSSKNEVNKLGRFPANLILTYDDNTYKEVCSGFPITSGGKIKLNSEVKRKGIKEDGSSFNSKTCGFDVNKGTGLCNYGDSGSASRYFYCAKASQKDRNEGLEEFEDKIKVFIGKSSSSSKEMKDIEKRFTTITKNTHPTVKPTQLMQYLVRLITPKEGTICDPFMGSGSTGKAVMYENKERDANYKFIGIELMDEYLPIADARIKFAKNSKDKEENIK